MSTDNTLSRRNIPLILLVILVALAAIGMLIFYATCLSDYTILDQGVLLPFSARHTYQVRFCDTFTLYLSPEQRPSLGLLNTYLLAGGAFASLTFAILLATVRQDRRSRRFWFFLLAYLGLTFLMADEAMGIHESVGDNLPFLLSLPLIQHPNDVIFALYKLPIILFLILFRGVIVSSRKAAILFAGALGAALLAASADILSLPVEEFLEVLAAACVTAGIMLLGVLHTSSSTTAHASSPATD